MDHFIRNPAHNLLDHRVSPQIICKDKLFLQINQMVLIFTWNDLVFDPVKASHRVTVPS